MTFSFMLANLRLWVFIFVFSLFVTVNFVHLSYPLIDSYECLSSCLFERFVTAFFVSGLPFNFERFRL